jgi:hypothetical protein
MPTISMRHYALTLGYTQQNTDRRLRDVRRMLRLHLSRRRLKQQIHFFLSRMHAKPA